MADELAYEADGYDPPAPVARVRVLGSDPAVAFDDVPMLLDTGAGVSLLPRARCAALVRADAPQVEVQGFDGNRSRTVSVVAEVRLFGKTFRGEFLLIDGAYGILGRNILNNLSLVLDGPNRCWSQRR